MVMLILGILGYMLTYIRGNPPNPTYTPQPQQQQLRINQFQVQVPRLLEMTNGSKDFNKKPVKRFTK